MKIDSLMVSAGPSIYYDEGFRNVLEDHMTFFRTHSTTTTLLVEPGVAYQYEFDLFSLLRYYKVPEQLHWLTMRMNGMTASTDVTRDVSALLVPDQTLVGQIAQSHKTSRKIG